jgi:hypothetical protein
VDVFLGSTERRWAGFDGGYSRGLQNPRWRGTALQNSRPPSPFGQFRVSVRRFNKDSNAFVKTAYTVPKPPPTSNAGGITPELFRVGHEYVDRANPKLAGDQFCTWLLIGMSGGVRWRKFQHLNASVPAFVVLVTTHVSADFVNPWDDVVDERAGVIFYWGDAKFGEKGKRCEAFPGNSCLLRVYDEILTNSSRTCVPPILHFQRLRTGRVTFTGLCSLEDAHLTWYEHGGRPVRNYRYQLAILDEEFVDPAWLRARIAAVTTADLNAAAPATWHAYVAGQTKRRQIWRAQLLTKEQQLPAAGSDDEKILQQFASLPAREFESAVVALFKEIKSVEHRIIQTRYVGDGGFDFFGTFTMALPVAYDVPFRAEVKRHVGSIGPKDVSRLVARLSRGQYGIFVTTSYYTKQAQEEVLLDSYPVRLFSGIHLVQFLRELKLVEGRQIKQQWLDSLQAQS